MSLPSVSIVVLNWNGRQYLKDCLEALRAQTYGGPFEIVVMDNGSTDGSAEFVREHFPDVRLLVSPHNLGFSGGNNFAARQLTMDALAFLNNDTRADPRWLEELVKVLTSAPDIASAAGKILTWDGSRIDFVASGATVTGFGLQLGWGETASEYDREDDILSPCGGSMVIWREIFEKVGRFDDDYFLFYEDLDLGWRLWVAGYRVRSAPKSLVRHVHHGAARWHDDQRKAVLYERNALYTIYKNYDDEHLAAILPAALLLTAEKATLMVGPDRRAYALPADAAPPQATGSGGARLVKATDIATLRRSLKAVGITGTARKLRDALRARLRMRVSAAQHDKDGLPRAAVSTLLALEQFGNHLPVLQQKRAAVQSLRRRPDAEILKLFRLPLEPGAPLDGFAEYHRRLMHTLGVDRWVNGAAP